MSKAVEALMDAVDTDARMWTPQLQAAAMGQFRQRLKQAMRGRLRPVTEVKPLVGTIQGHMFEIRWQNIGVSECDEDGRLVRRDVLVRLIHGEPQHVFPDAAIGLHAHEKLVFDDDPRRTRQAQQHEIAEAAAIYGAEDQDRWMLYEA